MKTALLIFVFVLSVVAYFIGFNKMKKKLSHRFDDREQLEGNQFYNRYYKNSNIPEYLVVQLVEHVAQELYLPSSKLRPKDRFDSELKVEKGWEFDSGNAMLLRELQNLAKKKKIIIDTSEINTLDDYIRIMAILCRPGS